MPALLYVSKAIPLRNKEAETMGNSKLLNNIKKNWQLYLFLLIPVIYIIIFAYYPMLGIQIAFKKYRLRLGIWGSPWIGFGNFIKFFESYQFYRVLKNTLFISIYSIIINFPLPIIFALFLNSMRSERFKRSVQTITYMPHFISVVVLVSIVMQITNPRVGLYGILYSSLNNGNYPNDLFANPQLFPHLYVWSGIWQSFGWDSIIYTAALSAVDPSLHEAAQIDGASRFKRLINVDLPCILPTATIMLIMRCGKVMSVGFEKAFLMQNSLNLSTSELISTYVYKIGLSATGSMDYSYSTAIGLFNSVINLILILLVNQFAKKFSENSLW